MNTRTTPGAEKTQGPLPWPKVRIGDRFEVRYGRSNPGGQGDVPVVGSSGIYAWTKEALITTPAIVIGRKGSAGKPWLIKTPSYPSDTTFYLTAPDNGWDLEFLYYALLHSPFAANDDVIPSLQRHELESREIPFPSIGEQRAIARILSRVQAAIATQGRLISRLQEFKAASMARIFRHGLKDNRRESRQTEHGPIPRGWKLVSCEELCQAITVGIVVTPAKFYVPRGVPCLRSLNVKEDRLSEKSLVFISPQANELHSKSRLCAGDIVVVRTGYPGTACVVPEKYHGANCIDLIIVRPNPNVIDSDYLARYINSDIAKRQILMAQGGLAQQHFNVGAMKRLMVAVPENVAEQGKVSKVGQALDKNIDFAERKALGLQRLFNATLHQLMAAKIRVRSTSGTALPSGEDYV